MSLNDKQFKRQKLDEHRARVMSFHADLAPMKKTIREQGVNFSAISEHLNKNSRLLFGKKLTKRERLSWAIRKHAEDPENFLKNIGMQ